MVRKGEVLLGSIYLGLSSSDPPPVQVSILELVVSLEHLGLDLLFAVITWRLVHKF